LSEDHARVVAMTTTVTLVPDDSQRLSALCGPFDQNLKHLEKRLGVHIRNRGNVFQVTGPEARLKAASALLNQLYVQTLGRDAIEPDEVHLLLQEAGVDALLAREAQAVAAAGKGAEVTIRTGRKTVMARGANQASYVAAIRRFDINFGIGPAGTGKTYLAVACAVEALEAQRVSRILLVRPAVEAGEKLGFLPGDLAQKIDPYLRPLYDALYEMMGVERVNKYIERNVIEVAPLAYMRGRTLNNAFIILDESQNTTVEQMKMFLTRSSPETSRRSTCRAARSRAWSTSATCWPALRVFSSPNSVPGTWSGIRWYRRSLRRTPRSRAICRWKTESGMPAEPARSRSQAIEVQRVSLGDTPAEDDLRRWVEAVLITVPIRDGTVPAGVGEVCLRLVDAEESAALNEQYRGKPGPTNVLSFPAEVDLPALRVWGDIVICVPLVHAEAAAQQKAAVDHFAHLVIHGVLHLLGYDHQAPTEAEQMESIESRVLGRFGIADPYGDG
jgi:phosphate starvation-inducible PhoH-like protein